jgi:type IV secretion system protein VirB10
LLAVELVTPLATDVTQRGDRFQARITEPTEFNGAILEGRVTQVKRPGKVKGVAQLQLRFEQVRFADNSTAEFHADIVEIVPTGSSSDVSIDSEGGLRGRDSTKDDVAKVGAASGIGAIIGGIAGGGHGAAIGAVIGGGAGTAGVMTQRGKDIRLDRGQVMKIKTSTDTGAVASQQ